jgi:hypothetical protein
LNIVRSGHHQNRLKTPNWQEISSINQSSLNMIDNLKKRIEANMFDSGINFRNNKK